ncbi:MAG: O-antigen ligase family protein [Endomicrobiaceae bacterium]|nr:O-antigen ligase family protein [Endomicrobiaceae bacterium]
MLFEGGGYLGVGGYYAPVIILVIIAAFMTAFRHGIVFRREHFYISILFIIMILHLNASVEYIESSRLIWGYILLFVMFFSLVLYRAQIDDLKYIKTSIILSAFIISFFIIVMRKEYGLSGRYTLDLVGLTDPNHVASFLTLGLVLNVKEIFFSFKKSNKFIYILSCIIILLAIMFTGSRGAFISLILSVPVLFFAKFKKFFIGMFFSVFIFGLSFLILPDYLTNRFLVDSYNDGSNQARIRLWLGTVEKISLHPIVGYGAVRSKNITRIGAAHNTFLAFALHFGLLGLLMMVFILWKIFINCLHKSMYLFLAVFINLMVNSIILENTNTMPFWFTLVFLAYAVNYKLKNPEVNLWNEI